MIELGAGTNPHPRTTTVLSLDAPARPVDIRDDWPVDDESADEVYASHVLEHIENGPPRIHVFNEAWRVLRPGGTFTMRFPVLGYEEQWTVKPYHVFADPTHVSVLWLPHSLTYFTNENPAHADYGIKPWARLRRIENMMGERMIEQQKYSKPPLQGASWWFVRDGWEGVARLEKVA